MAGTREIKRKIKSIKSTKQITRAMELVAASKMKKAVLNATSIRPYATNAMVVLAHVSEKTDPELHPFLVKRELRNCLVVMISSDRGLCGGFNATLVKKIISFEKEFKTAHPKCNLSYIAVGRKAETFLARTGRNLVASYGGLSNNPRLNDILSLNKLIFDYYKAGDYDMVTLVYQHFVSAVSQKPVSHQLLPFSRESMLEMGHSLGLFAEEMPSAPQSGASGVEYKFEPSASFILDNLIPGLVEMQIYHAVLESTASEHSSRMVAMHSATENANELINGLTLLFNQNRQAAITREIAEISAGKIALGL
ncbi:ATP synthase F1 subunit gamma [Candidatus Peregrinibacteria bacterium]|nr:ATP synthase F1 subunit gamma [Candidatus Peregrinibacteria bacterium]